MKKKVKATIQRVLKGQVALKPLIDGFAVDQYPCNGILIGNNMPGTKAMFVPDELIESLLFTGEATRVYEADTWEW